MIHVIPTHNVAAMTRPAVHSRLRSRMINSRIASRDTNLAQAKSAPDPIVSRSASIWLRVSFSPSR